MVSAAPTIVAIEANSAWVVILAVSLVTLPAALVLRRVIDRPGALASSLLLGLPLGLPLVAAVFFQESVLPEVSVLRPFAPRMVESADWSVLHLLFLPDGTRDSLIPYVFSGAPGRWLLLLGGAASSFMLLRRLAGTIALHRLVRSCEEVTPDSDPALIERVHKLAGAAGLKETPRILLLPKGTPGAFVMGGRRARILVSQILVDSLTSDELDGILAHEIAHVVARDLTVMVVAGLLRDVTAWNPLAHLAHRRLVAEREFEADRCAAGLTGKPLAVASSLLKMCELVGATPRGLSGAAAFSRRRRALPRRVANLIALADGRVSSSSAGRIPYIAAACLAAVLGLQAGAQVAQQADLAIVWGAESSTDGGTPKAKQRDDRHPLFGHGFALRREDLPRWAKAMSRWAKTHGLPRKNYVAASKTWQAVPLWDRASPGLFDVYRIDPLAPQPLRAVEP